MILAAHALLQHTHTPTREDIVEAISGNICRCTGYGQIIEAVQFAADRLRVANHAAARPGMMRRKGSRSGRRAPAESCDDAAPAAFRFVSTNRRVREDRRFVAGQGHFVADVALEGLLHVAILPSQHPAARIVSIDASAALAMPGVHYVLTGDELAAATDPLMNGLDTPACAALIRSRWARRAMPANGSWRWSPIPARWPKTPPKSCASSMSRCRS